MHPLPFQSLIVAGDRKPLELFPFQEEGIRALLARRSALLADDMGLGKTVQVIRATQLLFEERAIRRALIVCPVSLCANWQLEFKKWSGNLRAALYAGPDRFGMLSGNAQVLVCSYETLVNDLAKDTDHGTVFADIGIDLCVLDEAQWIKSAASNRNRILSKLIAPRRWALTGTPLENRPAELAAILSWLEPNEAEALLNPNFSRILRMRDTLMIRRTKEEVGIQIPGKTESWIPIPLDPAQSAEYQELVYRARLAFGSNPDRSELLGIIQNLRTTCTVSRDRTSSKFEYLENDLMQVEATGEKAIVFSSLPNLVFPELSRRLGSDRCAQFVGSMGSGERDSEHARFVNEPECNTMLASLRAAGVGITWTNARHVYHIDAWWNPQVTRQADDRAHRIGQTAPVISKRLFAPSTIEEGIMKLAEAKSKIFDAFIEGENTRVNHSGLINELLRAGNVIDKN